MEGIVKSFKYNDWYERFEAVVELSEGNIHYTSLITGYGIGAHIEKVL